MIARLSAVNAWGLVLTYSALPASINKPAVICVACFLYLRTDARAQHAQDVWATGNQPPTGFSSARKTPTVNGKLNDATTTHKHFGNGPYSPPTAVLVDSFVDALNHTYTFSYDTTQVKPPVTGVTNPGTGTGSKSVSYDLNKIEVEFTTGTWTTVETRTYDSDHNVLSRTNGLNKTWDMTYDTRGNLLTVTNPLVTYVRGAPPTSDGHQPTQARNEQPDPGCSSLTRSAISNWIPPRPACCFR